jgi:hypothetical protein
LIKISSFFENENAPEHIGVIRESFIENRSFHPDTPVPVPGLVIKPAALAKTENGVLNVSMGADVFYEDKQVFSVNETGRRLLELADGFTTLLEMSEHTGCNDFFEIGMFFQNLYEAGYIQNRIEISIWESVYE